MRVLLIYPPFRTAVSSLARVLKNKVPPLGLGYVGAALQQAGHEVKIIDADTEDKEAQVIIDEVKIFQPQLIGLSTTTITFHKTKDLAIELKKIFSDTPVVIGGNHLAIFPELTLDYDCFDYGVINEGELTIVELVNAIEGKMDIKDVNGIVYKKNSQIKKTEPRAFIPDLDKSPQLAWNLLSVGKYQDVLAKRKIFATMITSRGCPYNCIYCERDCRLGRTYRMRSVQSIMDEIELLYNKYSVREIVFYDDTFTVKKDRVINLCQKIIDKKWDLIWECRTRVDLVDEDLLKIMKKAGCYRIRFGVEAGNPEILKVLKKNITLEQVRNAFSFCHKLQIEAFAYFMIGSPHETKKTVWDTINLAKEIEADYVMFSPTQLHGHTTDLFEWAVEHGYIDKDYWKRWVKGEDLDSFPYLSTSDLSKEEVVKYVKIAYRNFYFRPRVVIKMLSKCRNFETLKKYSFIALNMVSKKFRG